MNTLLLYPLTGAFQILSWSLFSNNQEWAEECGCVFWGRNRTKLFLGDFLVTNLS